jgi:hypothetical protein
VAAPHYELLDIRARKISAEAGVGASECPACVRTLITIVLVAVVTLFDGVGVTLIRELSVHGGITTPCPGAIVQAAIVVVGVGVVTLLGRARLGETVAAVRVLAGFGTGAVVGVVWTFIALLVGAGLDETVAALGILTGRRTGT